MHPILKTRAIGVLFACIASTSSVASPVYFRDRNQFEANVITAPSVFDFESVASGYVGTAFSFEGVDVTSASGLHIRTQADYATYGYTGNFLSNNGTNSSGMILRFMQAISAFGADVGTIMSGSTGSTTVRFVLQGEGWGETYYYSLNSAQGSVEPMRFFGFVSDLPVTSIQISDTRWESLDNISYVIAVQAVEIPEPTSLSLAILALIAVSSRSSKLWFAR